MADGGKVIIKIDGDDSGFKKAMGGLGKISKTALKGIAVGAAGASVAIAGIGKSAISAYADYEQLVGGVETLFKNSSDIVMNYANQAYQSAGLSANQYMETITGFSASLLQSLGSDTVKAAEYGNRAVVDMSDNANKMGTDIQRIQDAYQGFAKQNYTMLDNLKLGYGGTKTEMERLVKDAAKLDKSIKANDLSFGNIVKSIHAVQTELGITGTTAKEAATTIQGSAKMMKSAWGNLMTGIADPTQDFDVLVQNFVDSVVTFGKNIVPRIEIVVKGIVDLFKSLAPKIVSAIQEILPQVLGGFGQFLSGILGFVIENIKPIITVIGELTAVFMAFKAVSFITDIISSAQIALASFAALSNPIGVLATAIGLVTGAIMLMVASANDELTRGSELIAQSEARIEKLNEEAEAYNNLKESQQEQAVGDLARLQNVQTLYNELQNYVSANGEVQDSDKARVDFILNELNSALGTQYGLVGNIVQGYQELVSSVNDAIAAEQAQIILAAERETYEAAIKGIATAQQEQTQTALDLAEAQAILAAEESNLIYNVGPDGEKYIIGATQEYVEAQQAVKELTEEYGKQSEQVEQYRKDMSQYEEDYAAVVEGRTSEVIANYMSHGSAAEDLSAKIQESSATAQQVAGQNLATAILNLDNFMNTHTGTLTKAEQETLKMLQDEVIKAGEEAKNVGIAIDDGIVTGINGRQYNVSAAISRIASMIPAGIKQLLGIHSPSTVMRDQVGAMIDKGIAVGIDKNASEVEKALDSMNKTMLESEYKYLAEKQRLEDEAAAKALQKKYDDAEKELKEAKEKAKDAAAIQEAEAKYAEKIEKIKQDEINDAQEKAQDAYLAQLKETADREKKIYEARQKDIENAKQAIKDNFKALAEAAFDSIEEIESAEANLADKLKSFGDLYTTRTVERGNGKTYEIVKLADIEKQTKALEDYADKLLAVKERGDVPQEFFATLRDLSVEEGTKFADALLKADDKAFNKYIEDWKAKQKAADEISKVLYADEAQAAKDEIERSFNEFDTDLTRKGTQNAEAWGNAFFNEAKRTMQKVLTEIYRSFDGIVNTPSFAVSGGGGTVKNYSTYNHYDLPKVEVPVNLGGREVDRLIYNSYNNELKRMGK